MLNPTNDELEFVHEMDSKINIYQNSHFVKKKIRIQYTRSNFRPYAART